VLERAAERLREAQAVFVLTGSGISADSGLPTFRGVGGLWRSHRVEELASPAGFERDPLLVWTWYNERRAAHGRAEPNAGHRALVALEERVPRFTLATQNVDSLHKRAGSRNLLELHGNLREARCSNCGARRDLADGMPLEAIEHACGGRFRPDIVWFGEPLPPGTWAQAAAAAAEADVMLVVGTSGLVNPAAALCTRFGRQAYIVEVNPEPTAITPHAAVHIADTAARALPLLADI
jgi:NAD-dependent protein deacetylase/lipoamidase